MLNNVRNRIPMGPKFRDLGQLHLHTFCTVSTHDQLVVQVTRSGFLSPGSLPPVRSRNH